jgi:hypothetical protein
MARLFTTRRSEWVPGLGLLGAAVGIGALLGGSLVGRSWLVSAGVLVALLAVYAWRLLRRRRATRPPQRPSRPLELIRGGKPDYDLASDDSTDDQRWLM